MLLIFFICLLSSVVLQGVRISVFRVLARPTVFHVNPSFSCLINPSTLGVLVFVSLWKVKNFKKIKFFI